jgi:very-short-patch-repair endonuclease
VVVGDVLMTAGRPMDRRTSLRAAALAVGGVVSHLSAAELWQLSTPTDGRRIHVTTPPRTHTPVAGIRLHRRRLPASDVVAFDGIPVTSRIRTVVDCLAWLPYVEAVRLLDDCIRTRVLAPDRLAARVAEAARTHGVRQLRKLLDLTSAGAWSQAERLLHDLLKTSSLSGWQANASVVLPGGGPVVVDVWFPESRLAIEVDGRAWHASGERFQRDRSRQNRLVVAGVTVLRFTWDDLTLRPDQVIRTVRAALGGEACGEIPQQNLGTPP